MAPSQYLCHTPFKRNVTHHLPKIYHIIRRKNSGGSDFCRQYRSVCGKIISHGSTRKYTRPRPNLGGRDDLERQEELSG